MSSYIIDILNIWATVNGLKSEFYIHKRRATHTHKMNREKRKKKIWQQHKPENIIYARLKNDNDDNDDDGNNTITNLPKQIR